VAERSIRLFGDPVLRTVMRLRDGIKGPGFCSVTLPASSLWRVRSHELISDHLIILDGEQAAL